MYSYERIKELYDANVWDEKAVGRAVQRQWITKEEFKKITGREYKSATS